MDGLVKLRLLHRILWGEAGSQTMEEEEELERR